MPLIRFEGDVLRHLGGALVHSLRGHACCFDTVLPNFGGRPLYSTSRSEPMCLSCGGGREQCTSNACTTCIQLLAVVLSS